MTTTTVLVIVSPSGEGMTQAPDTSAGRALLASWLDLYREHRGAGYRAERWTLTATGDTFNVNQPTHREPVAL